MISVALVQTREKMQAYQLIPIVQTDENENQFALSTPTRFGS
jgi:hypothetical protein